MSPISDKGKESSEEREPGQGFVLDLAVLLGLWIEFEFGRRG